MAYPFRKNDQILIRIHFQKIADNPAVDQTRPGLHQNIRSPLKQFFAGIIIKRPENLVERT